LSFSAVFKLTSPVASSNPYEHSRDAKPLLGSPEFRSAFGRFQWEQARLALASAICTEKNLVVSFAVPVVSVH